ncbi:MAG: D-glycero-beta-D-manno-heptose 1-phosphate adenylyltransferase [Candidatus Riflebacteria bacterium]|nr:D-glycero-beta-D-manno-heptose 1-phosphate adenylyltransferase [Candidatus Riflebacteria bacterium]
MGLFLKRGTFIRTLVRLRRDGRRVVFTNGCFDLIHVGHVRLLKEARGFGDVLAVGVNTDRSVRRLKGPDRPVVPQAFRAEVLAALSMVDYVTLFDEPTPKALIEAILPTVLVKGGDYRPETVVGREAVEASGGEVRIVSLVPGFSTTELLRRLQKDERRRS